MIRCGRSGVYVEGGEGVVVVVVVIILHFGNILMFVVTLFKQLQNKIFHILFFNDKVLKRQLYLIQGFYSVFKNLESTYSV